MTTYQICSIIEHATKVEVARGLIDDVLRDRHALTDEEEAALRAAAVTLLNTARALEAYAYSERGESTEVSA